ncbi:Na/Pi cotransporter family protein [Candidatus Electronema sp. JC]|uniref:Na/Pi cotransporter family protein n=1 Tax=Candidatus Electronema sp. JC TaxID=3401570 RepID=UPI003B42E613
MISILSTVFGGIGLFLLGMILMTDGLKAMAGDSLRSVLSRFTGNRFSAVTMGALVTALVQSSSATTLATIGFVSAGLLGFGSAVGIMLGANLGTTSTGWLVGLLGLKLSIGDILLPFIGVGALARLIGRGRLAQAGSALAGFGVIFVGIDVLQGGMQELAQNFKLDAFAQPGLAGRAWLVLIGAAMTVVMQSSSAAVATTLTALSSGAIDLSQSAALVVGQNLGTTVTAGIAAVGATAAAKRTAAVHLLFNFGTGIVAFAALPWLVAGVEALAEQLWQDDAALTLAAFHTLFNLIGLLIFLPLTHQLAALTERIIPERRSKYTARLDPSLLSIPAVAFEAAWRSQAQIASSLFRLLAHDLAQGIRPQEQLLDQLDLALDEVRHFLAKIERSEGRKADLHRQISALHANDHLERLVQDARKAGQMKDELRQMENLARAARSLSSLLGTLADDLDSSGGVPDVAAVQDFSQRLADERRSARPAILEATASKQMEPDAALKALSAQRWIDRLAYHAWRCGHHFRITQGEESAGGANPPQPQD